MNESAKATAEVVAWIKSDATRLRQLRAITEHWFDMLYDAETFSDGTSSDNREYCYERAGQDLETMLRMSCPRTMEKVADMEQVAWDEVAREIGCKTIDPYWVRDAAVKS